MSINLGLLIVIGIMAAAGVYLLTERSLIRMLFGLLLTGNAINLLIVVVSGPPGHPPIRGRESSGQSFDADPLAQGMVLTAIVITLGIAAFVLAMAYRLFQINQAAEDEKMPPGTEAATDDELGDDEEDIKILTGSFESLPDRDRSDDPLTGADTVVGDLFDARGNPMTEDEFKAAHINVHEPDLMPEDADVLDRLPDDGDEMPDDSDTVADDPAENGGIPADSFGLSVPDGELPDDGDVPDAHVPDAHAPDADAPDRPEEGRGDDEVIR